MWRCEGFRSRLRLTLLFYWTALLWGLSGAEAGGSFLGQTQHGVRGSVRTRLSRPPNCAAVTSRGMGRGWSVGCSLSPNGTNGGWGGSGGGPREGRARMQAGPPRVPIVRPELQGKRRVLPEKTTLGSHQRVGTGGGVPAAEAGQARPPPPSSRVGRGRHGLSFLPPPSTSSTDHVPWSPSKGWVLSFIQRDVKASRPLAATAGWIIGSGQNGRPQPNRPLRPSSKGTSPLPGLGPDAVRCSGRDLFLPQAGLVPDAPLSGRGPVVRPPTEAHPCLADLGPRCGHGQLPTPMLGLLESDCPHERPVPLDTPSRLRIRASRGLCLGAACTVVTIPGCLVLSGAGRPHPPPATHSRLLCGDRPVIRSPLPASVFPRGTQWNRAVSVFLSGFYVTDTISVRWSSPACPAPSSLFHPLPETSFPGRLPTEFRECTAVCSFDSPDAAQAPTTGPGTQ